MTRIVIDDVLIEKLKSVKGPIELCDASGAFIGRVVRSPDPALYEGLECPLTPEELAERLRNPGKLYTPEQVTEMLEKR